MADKKISALTGATTPLAGSEVLPIVQGGSTVKVSVANLTAGRSTSASEIISDDGVQGRWTVTQEAGGNRLYSTTPAFGGWRTCALQANGTAPNMVWGSNGDTTVGVGNLVMGTAGKGIDFSANTHAPGMTSELLNWYEEGTWTPTDASGAGLSFTSASGRYTRMGNVVFLFGFVQYPVTASGNNATIGGLPFTANSNASATQGAVTYSQVATVRSIGVQPSSTNAAIYTLAGGVATNANMSNTSLYFNATYFV